MNVKVEINSWQNDIKIVKLISEKLEVHLLSLGATIQSVIYPGDEDVNSRDVILGFDTMTGYDGTENPFFWGTTGRYTNRVKDGRFNIDGKEHQLSRNDFGNNLKHHLHGGVKSYDRLNWNTELLESGDGVVFSIVDPNGHEGYPGTVISSVSYRLSEGCHLDIEMRAVSDMSTIINMSNHVYFNLAGHGAGWEGLKQHKLAIAAETFTPDDEEYLPTGEILPVAGTENDFRSPQLLADRVVVARGGEGYCVNFCVDNNEDTLLMKVASLMNEETKRLLEVWSDQPGLELYTGNFLPENLIGKNGRKYGKWGGVCLMTQNFRDACNHPNFPSSLLRPGQVYTHRASYRFHSMI